MRATISLSAVGGLVPEKGRGAHLLEDALVDPLDRRLARARELGPPALLVHLGLEAGLVDAQPAPLGDHPGQIGREAVGVVETKGQLARHHRVPQPPRLLLEQANPPLEGVAEAALLLADHLADDAPAFVQLGIDAGHLGDHALGDVGQERLADAEQPAVVDGPAHDPAQDVFAPGLVGEHAVGDQEGRRPAVVGDGPHRDRGGSGGVVRGDELLAREPGHLVNQGAQEVDLVVGSKAPQDRGQPLEAHAGVDRGPGQGTPRLVRELLVLHEHEVPDLDPAIAVAGRAQAGTAGRHLEAGDVVALVKVDLAAGAAGTGVAHGPEVVLVPQPHDQGVGHPGHLAPQGPRLLVCLVDGVDEAPGVERVLPGEQLVGEGDGLLLEVVAEGEVAQHLEEGVVPRGAAHVLQIVVLAPGAHALLRAGGPGVSALGLAREDVLELVHACVGEQQGRIVAGDQRGAGDGLMAPGGEELEEGAPNLM